MRVAQEKPSFLATVLIIVMFLMGHALNAQNCLDNHIFLTTKNSKSIHVKLAKGYRCFVLDKDLSANQLKVVNRFLSGNRDELLVFILSNQTEGWLDSLAKHPLKEFLAIPASDSLCNVPALKKENKRLILFGEKESEYTFNRHENIVSFIPPEKFPYQVKKGFKGKVTNDLVLFDLENYTLKKDSLLNDLIDVPKQFNRRTGKLPNFFVTKQLELFNQYRRYYNSRRWYNGKVEYLGETLEDVHWREIPEMVSNGKFHITEGKVSPLKDGFDFSPDVFGFNSINARETKLFNASPKDLNEDLVLWLDFNKNTNNQAEKDQPLPYSRFQYVKDEYRGWCASFKSRLDYIDYGSTIDLKENITISVWVNAEDVNKKMSILGKGEVFSVKVHEGRLVFTAPGIKDYSSQGALVEYNGWQHLTAVFTGGKHVRFYKNGLFFGQQETSNLITTGHSLLIATNLWDENFIGEMDDIRLWNRALSDKEVRQVYGLNGAIEKAGVTNWFFWAMIIPVLIGVLVIVIRKRRSKVTIKSDVINKKKEILTIKDSVVEAPQGPCINLFGGFTFINRDGEDLTANFSVRRKQLFTLVLIASLEKDGISSKELTKSIWAGYSPASAKNNRSTQMQRLREIFEQNTGISIVYEDRKWQIRMDEDIECDLAHYFRLLKEVKQWSRSSYDENILSALLDVIEKGAFLPQMDDEWLDSFKLSITDQLLEYLMPVLQDSSLNDELKYRLADTLLVFDPLNETLLKYKISILIHLGKKTLAHECYEHYCKNYHHCYDQDFDISFTELIAE